MDKDIIDNITKDLSTIDVINFSLTFPNEKLLNEFALLKAKNYIEKLQNSLKYYIICSKCNDLYYREERYVCECCENYFCKDCFEKYCCACDGADHCEKCYHSMKYFDMFPDFNYSTPPYKCKFGDIVAQYNTWLKNKN